MGIVIHGDSNTWGLGIVIHGCNYSPTCKIRRPGIFIWAIDPSITCTWEFPMQVFPTVSRLFPL